MNRTFAIDLNRYSNSTGFEQALDAKQSLCLMYPKKLSYKRRDRWLECSDVGSACWVMRQQGHEISYLWLSPLILYGGFLQGRRFFFVRTGTWRMYAGYQGRVHERGRRSVFCPIVYNAHAGWNIQKI